MHKCPIKPVSNVKQLCAPIRRYEFTGTKFIYLSRYTWRESQHIPDTQVVPQPSCWKPADVSYVYIREHAPNFLHYLRWTYDGIYTYKGPKQALQHEFDREDSNVCHVRSIVLSLIPARVLWPHNPAAAAAAATATAIRPALHAFKLANRLQPPSAVDDK